MFNLWSVFRRHLDKVIRLIRLLLVINMTIVLSLGNFLVPTTHVSAAVSGFVTRSGNKLMLNGR